METAPNPSPSSSPTTTTFIQADAQSFKQVVQMLTGSADTAVKHAKSPPFPPINKAKKAAFKLYERRPGAKGLSMTVGTHAADSSGSLPSPSMLDFPSLALSPVTASKPKLLPLFPVTSPRDDSR